MVQLQIKVYYKKHIPEDKNSKQLCILIFACYKLSNLINNIFYFPMIFPCFFCYEIISSALPPEISPMIIDPIEKISDIHDVGIGMNDVSSNKMKSQLLAIKIITKIAWGIASPRFSNNLKAGRYPASISFVIIRSGSLSPVHATKAPAFNDIKGVMT